MTVHRSAKGSYDTGAESEVLLGDIGATNARFACLTGDHLGAVHTFEVAQFGSFEEVLTCALQSHFADHAFKSGVFALAGPIDHGRCILTNTSWMVDPRALKSSIGFDVRIVNDFQAVAYSLPTLTLADVKKVG